MSTIPSPNDHPFAVVTTNSNILVYMGAFILDKDDDLSRLAISFTICILSLKGRQYTQEISLSCNLVFMLWYM